MTALFLHCGDAPEIVFPKAGKLALISGRIYPALPATRVYLLSAGGIDSTAPDTITEMFEFRDVPYGFYYLQVKTPGYGTRETKIQADYPVINLADIKLTRRPLLIFDVDPDEGTVIDSAFINNRTANVNDSSVIIRIYFEEAMDTASVCGALSIEPLMPRARCIWASGNNLQVHIPRNELDGEDILLISIGTDAHDRYGHCLEMNFTIAYPVDSGLGSAVPPPLLVGSFSPADGDRNVGTTAPVVVTFDSLMHDASVENAFGIEPPAVPRFSWEYYNKKYRLSVSFAYGLTCGTWYTVTFAAGWMTVDSSMTGSTFSFRFETERPAIRSTYPRNGETGVGPGTSLSFTTNFLAENDDFLRALTIRPPLDSLKCTVDPTQVRIEHAPFDSGTTYVVSVDSSLRLPGGGSLGRMVVFTFSTVRENAPKVLSDTVTWTASPADKSDEVSVNQGFYITFGRLMDSTAVESSLTVSPPVSYYTGWSRITSFGSDVSGHRLYIRPMHYLRSGTVYTVSIDSGMFSLDGIGNNPIRFSFTTVPLLLIGHTPAMGQINADRSIPLSLTFNMAIDTSTLCGAIRSAPPINDLAVDSVAAETQSLSTRWTYRLKHGALLADTTYEIAVDTTVTDLFGTACGNGASFEFSTGE